MPASQQWIETALKITGHFEDSSDPLGAVSGDFDGMGISLGVLQWNIGSSSLQPLVRNVGRANVVALMPHYGVDLWTACNSSVPQGLSIVRGWQNGSTLRQPVFHELKVFTHSPQFVAQQVQAADRVASDAYDLAVDWARADDPTRPATKAMFCWFFDVLTQNGGLKGLGHDDVQSFISQHGTAASDDVVCDFLFARNSLDAGFRDSNKNSLLWRNKIAAKDLTLVVLSYLRALRSRTQYRGDVLNRKATIAIGEGWVHMEHHDLRELLAG